MMLRLDRIVKLHLGRMMSERKQTAAGLALHRADPVAPNALGIIKLRLDCVLELGFGDMPADDVLPSSAPVLCTGRPDAECARLMELRVGCMLSWTSAARRHNTGGSLALSFAKR